MKPFKVAFEPERPWLMCHECMERAVVQYTYLHEDFSLRITGYCLHCALDHELIREVPIERWGLAGGTKRIGEERYEIAVQNTLDTAAIDRARGLR